MGRKPLNKKETKINGKSYNFVPKQIILKGIILDMFNFDRINRDWNESQLGAHIIGEYYRKTPPLGFYTKDKPKD